MADTKTAPVRKVDIFVSPPATTPATGLTLREKASSHLQQCPLWLPLAIVVIVVCLAVLFAMLQWRSRPIHCSSNACTAFAKLLKSSMNSSSVNPCHSFGRFVCDGWKLSSALSVRALYYRNALELLMRTAKSTEVPVSHQNAPQQAAALLATCDRVKKGEQDEIEVVKRYLAEAGVLWPEQAANPEVMDTMLYLDVQLNWPAFLHFQLTTDVGRAVVFITVASSFYNIHHASTQLTKDERRSYFDTLYKHYTGRSTSNDVAFGEVLEADIAVAPLNYFLRKGPYVWLRDEDLFPSAADWLLALSRRFGRTLPEDARFLTDNDSFVTHLFALWSKLGERMMHRCVSWHAVQYAALTANSELLYNMYGKDLKEHGLEFRKLCLVLSYRSMGDLVFAGFTDAFPLSLFRDDTRALVYAVRRGFTDRITDRKPFSRNLDIVARWSSVEPVFAVLDHKLHVDYRKPVPGFPDMNTTHFVPNWRIMAQAWRSGASVKGKLDVQDILRYGFFSIDWNNEDFFLSPFALSFPLYDVELTPALKYGGLGSQVALASSVVLLYHYQQHAHNDWDMATYLQNARDCVNKSLQGVAHSVATVVAELASLEALADAIVTNGSNDLSVLHGGLEQYSEMQMFFIAWCFLRCGEQRIVDGENVEVDPCSHVLRHVRRFSEAFQCEPGTFLNPEAKCEVF
ncbi:neprilysin-1 [Rhipicephalus microplus]|uniref:neprilysin-1 n=1 Tax=Rhipicephalus microplus TaxID=6941 RepID=UPI003F6C52C7